MICKNAKKELIEAFSILIQYVDAKKVKHAGFKKRQYNEIIKLLTSYEDKIDSPEVVKQLLIKEAGMKNPKKTMMKINEYFETGQISEVEEAKKDPKITAVRNFMRIYAIGPSKAVSLFDEYNISTIDELKSLVKTKSKVLNKKQMIGLKYHDDLEKRIPRFEIGCFKKIFESITKDIGIEMSINGSYRRGCETSGDIDVLIKTKNEWVTEIGKSLKLMVNKLSEMGIIKEKLAFGKKKFMGLVIIPGETRVVRHLDIIETTPQEYPFAKLYFTGSGGFNVKMRKHANSLGYSINEYCLTLKQKRGVKDKIIIDEKTIFDKIGKYCFETEKDIFKFLDYTYLEPSKRKGITLSKIK